MINKWTTKETEWVDRNYDANGFVYTIYDTKNDLVYVGITQQPRFSFRWDWYKKTMKRDYEFKPFLINHMIKTGIENFIYNVFCFGQNLEELSFIEEHTINFYKSLNKSLNHKPGGDNLQRRNQIRKESVHSDKYSKIPNRPTPSDLTKENLIKAAIGLSYCCSIDLSVNKQITNHPLSNEINYLTLNHMTLFDKQITKKMITKHETDFTQS